MATTREDIARWLERGKQEGATHVIIVCDTFDHGDYPVFVKGGPAAAREKYQEYLNGEHEMQRVMEVYNLSGDINAQLSAQRTFELEGAAEFEAPLVAECPWCGPDGKPMVVDTSVYCAETSDGNDARVTEATTRAAVICDICQGHGPAVSLGSLNPEIPGVEVLTRAATEAWNLLRGAPNDIRNAGWAVAVHTDYDGGKHTSWLFTKDDEYVKGEGSSDAEALDTIRAKLRWQP